MGRYVVVEFDRNEDATEFVNRINDRNAAVRRDGMSTSNRIVGIFVRPGMRCSCWDRDTVNYRDPTKEKNAAGIARGEKFGWWVCSRCNKPRLAGHQLVNQMTLSDTYEAPLVNEVWENQVDGLSITCIHRKQVKRPKKLRLKRKKGK